MLIDISGQQATRTSPIARRSVKRRIVAISQDRRGQYAAKCLLDFDLCLQQGPRGGPGDLNYFLPRVSVGQHGIRESDPFGELRAGANNSRIAVRPG